MADTSATILSMTPKQFQSRLLNWFKKSGRHDLPWQKNKSPYRVWVSEIMLQQTQVATVKPYFEKFMQSFPNIESLAAASIDMVLHLWTGLGYYSRARNLHRSSQMIMEKFHGKLPDKLEDLMQLPGVGQSTAGAILALAFNREATILDGNVKRVLTRIHGIAEPVIGKVEYQLWQLAQKYTPKKSVAEYTQAIMDMGATLCTRSKPNCGLCPVQDNCEASRLNKTDVIPAKRKKIAVPTKHSTFLIVKHDDAYFMMKRSFGSVWESLYSFPEISGKISLQEIKNFSFMQLKMHVTGYKRITPFKHSFSHYHLWIHPILLNISNPLKVRDGDQQIWYNPQKPANIGLPKPVLKIIRGLLQVAPHSMRKIK